MELEFVERRTRIISNIFRNLFLDARLSIQPQEFSLFFENIEIEI